jgi:hypothetical protein
MSVKFHEGRRAALNLYGIFKDAALLKRLPSRDEEQDALSYRREIEATLAAAEEEVHRLQQINGRLTRDVERAERQGVA